MITDKMFRDAATESYMIYVHRFESTYDPDRQHEFSVRFQKKIAKLKRKVDAPFFYGALRYVASILLAVAVSLSTWLAVDVKAREAFFGWVKEVYETYFVYRFNAETAENTAPVAYRLGWLPDGYSELFEQEGTDTTTIIYKNESELLLTFKYIHTPDLTQWYIDVSQTTKKAATVLGNTADLFISTDPDISSAIMWISENNTAFYISAFLDEAELIKIAENVEKN